MLRSLYDATFWRSLEVRKMSKPAAIGRSRKYGSVKLRSTKVLKVPIDKPSRSSWPLPSRLRSLIEMSPRMPDVVEKPAPKEMSPVLCSTTWTSRLVLSGAEPGCAEMSTFSKKPRLRRRCWLRRTLAVEKASPSASRNSRRITLSSVRVLPEMLMRST